MQTTRTATATVSSTNLSARVWWTIHAVTAAWIVFFLVFGNSDPLSYSAWLQEDGFVEWLTVFLFAAAAAVRIRSAWHARSWFDLLIAAFCLFVAGEEFSWGQRLLGFTPPDVFLEHNKQQEFTLHNFAEVFGQPKGLLMVALAGYAALPWLGRFRVPGTAPPIPLVPWFLVAVALLWTYPLDLTGEWVEAMAGWLFLVSALPPLRALMASVSAAVLASVLFTFISARGLRSNPSVVACAQSEARALALDITRRGAARAQLYEFGGRVHKRLFTAAEAGYIDVLALFGYRAIGCGQSQRYLLDPWGMPYWIRVAADRGEGRLLTVYSMGPNRRRDSAGGTPSGDDVLAEDLLQ